MILSITYLTVISFLFVTSDDTSIEKDKSTDLDYSTLNEDLSVEPKRREWGYSETNGPNKWDSQCLTGMKQSPINIELGKVQIKLFPEFLFDSEYRKKVKFLAVNNGHTIKVTLKDNENKAVIGGGGLNGKYAFAQLHFHWEAEHLIEGNRGALEMHMVHYNTKYESYYDAKSHRDGLMVLAVLFNERNETKKDLERFLNSILDEAMALQPFNKDPIFSLRSLLPEHVSRYFRYQGSLTTPACEEVVKWTIFVNRFPVSKALMNKFKSLKDKEMNPIITNSRPVQPLNGRDIFISLINYEREGRFLPNCANYNTAFSIYLLCCTIVVYFRFGY